LHVERLEDRCYLSASPFSLGSLPLEQFSPLLLPTHSGPSVSQTPDSQSTPSANVSSSNAVDHGSSSAFAGLSVGPTFNLSEISHDFAYLDFGHDATNALTSAGQETSTSGSNSSASLSYSLSSPSPVVNSSPTDALHLSISNSLGNFTIQFSGAAPTSLTGAVTTTATFPQLEFEPGPGSENEETQEAGNSQSAAIRTVAIDAALTLNAFPGHLESIPVDSVRIVRIDPNSPAPPPIPLAVAGNSAATLPTQLDGTRSTIDASRTPTGPLTNAAATAASAPITYNPVVNGQTVAGVSSPTAATAQTLQSTIQVQSGTPSPTNGASDSDLNGSLLIPSATEQPGRSYDVQSVSFTGQGMIRSTNASAVSASPSQAALVTLPYDFQAVDAALDNLLNEIDDLSGDLAGWLGVPSLPRWSVVAAGVIACAVGGQQVQRARRRRASPEENELESLSRMFTRWQGLSV
jgi:hypothetical protein